MRRADEDECLKALNKVLQHPKKSLEFEKYLRGRGEIASLEFVWACNGIKLLGENRSKVVTSIYRRFVLNGQIRLSSKTLLSTIDILLQLSQGGRTEDEAHLSILEEMEKEVVTFLGSEMIPHFNKKSKKGKRDKTQNLVNDQDGLSILPPLLHHSLNNSSLLSSEEFAKTLTSKLEALEMTKVNQEDEKETFEDKSNIGEEKLRHEENDKCPNKKRFFTFKNSKDLFGPRINDEDNGSELVHLITHEEYVD